MVDRKKELKKWLIDHEMNVSDIGEMYGCSRQAAYTYLVNAQSAPSAFVELCLDKGIPANLLPVPTRPKSEIIEENKRMSSQLSWCWSALERFYIEPGEISVG
jgi:hypothetical protein